jgi:hypothetical protein
MKQKDIALILVVVGVSAIISFIVSSTFIAPAKNRQQKVEVVDRISTDFNRPDPKYFNAQSLNPTQEITIGDNTNTNPFNGQPNQ